MAEPIYSLNQISIFRDDYGGYYYTKKIEGGIEGNYYDRDIWPSDALEALLACIIHQLANRFTAIAPILRGNDE